VLTGRRFRLDLTMDQLAMCGATGAACRDVWNTGLEQRRRYRAKGAWMTYVSQAAELTEARAAFPWLAEISVEVLQQTLMDLDRACRDHGTFAVRWRAKGRWHASFRFPRGQRIEVERIAKKWGRAKLPKLGWVRIRWSRAPGAPVRSATVSFRGGAWWISPLVEDGEVTPEHHSGSPVGVSIAPQGLRCQGVETSATAGPRSADHPIAFVRRADAPVRDQARETSSARAMVEVNGYPRCRSVCAVSSRRNSRCSAPAGSP
jgi:putative transposase